MECAWGLRFRVIELWNVLGVSDQDVLENMLIDYFGDEGTVEREFNCLITFIKINNDITLQ